MPLGPRVASRRNTVWLLPLVRLLVLRLFWGRRPWVLLPKPKKENRPPPRWPFVFFFSAARLRSLLAAFISSMPARRVFSLSSRVPRILVTQPWIVDFFWLYGRIVPSDRMSF